MGIDKDVRGTEKAAWGTAVHSPSQDKDWALHDTLRRWTQTEHDVSVTKAMGCFYALSIFCGSSL